MKKEPNKCPCVIYENDEIRVVKKRGNIEVGYQFDTAVELMLAAAVGIKEFASLLKEPEKAVRDFQDIFEEQMSIVRGVIAQQRHERRSKK